MRQWILWGPMAAALLAAGCSTTSESQEGSLMMVPGPDAIGHQQPWTTELEIKRTVTCRYLLYLPDDYASKDRWPLMMFLHGAGERGDDIERVKIHGPAKLIGQGKSFPFIVLTPLCQEGQWWDIQMLSRLLDHIEEMYKVDLDRVYLTGLSMGGFGTWGLAAAEPDRFAAVAPICGGGEPKSARYITHLPVWVFHGDNDTVVPLERSQQMVDALKAAGGNPKFTVYPGVGHDSWTETYNNPELYGWLLSHKRNQPDAR